jgi:nitrite reductase/ring-hydroxylating ferredoxin subunit
MALEVLADAVDGLRGLDRPAERLERALAAAFTAGGRPAQRLKNVLHGTWLGHPLHPVLTDVPIGAWTAGLVLDALDARGRRTGPGADAALAVGVGGAVAAALTGMTDWQHTAGRARRIGLTHGLLNTTSLACYLTSLGLRRRGRRRAGRRAALLGYLVSALAAYLGGHLVYALRIGVDHAADAPRPSDFVPVLPDAGLPEGQARCIELEGAPVLLVRRGGRIDAIAATCSHLGGPLARGRIEDGVVQCPWHGSRFALDDGRVVDGPATFAQPGYETRVRAGHVELRARTRSAARATVAPLTRDAAAR